MIYAYRIAYILSFVNKNIAKNEKSIFATLLRKLLFYVIMKQIPIQEEIL